jgi:parallel beta-helix repeat protein
MKLNLVIIILLYFFTNQLNAEYRYVDVNSSNPQSPYTSWETAARKIKDAIEITNPGDIVVVANGIYYTSSQLFVTNGIKITSLNGPNLTIVDCNETHRGFYLTSGNIVEGFTITNGYVTGSESLDNGGGIICDYGGYVNNCIIRCCKSRFSALFLYYGGLADNCIIEGNEVSVSGSAVYLYKGGTIRNSLLINNDAWDGGAVFFREKGGTVYNCTIYGNTADQRGSGVYFENGGTLINSIVWGNSGSVNVYGPGIIETNDNNCLQDWSGPGNNIITSNPLFINVNSNNFRLMPTSPCINNGTNMSWMNGNIDLDGRPRIIENIVDIGCYESGQAGLRCSFSSDITSGNIPLEVHFNAEVEGTNLDSIVYYWDFNGDNIIDKEGINLDVTSYIYTNEGSYSVSLTVSNAVGEVASYTLSNYITAILQVIAAFSASPVTGDAPLTVSFLDQSSNNPLGWTWDLDGDGFINSTERNPYYTYWLTGTYSVTLSVSNLSTFGILTKTNLITVTGESIHTHYASLTGAHVYPYITWETAATNIQDAIDVGIYGDTIYIASGTYIIDTPLLVNKSLIIESTKGPLYTFINGNYMHRGFEINNSNAIVRGLTISNCFVSGNKNGGGVHIFSGVLDQCILVDNHASGNGGGVYTTNSINGIIRNSLIYNNSAINGGGVYADGNLKIENCTIVSNFANQGAGIYCQDDIICINTIVFDNNNDNVYNSNYFPIFRNCCIYPLMPGSGNIDNNPIFLKNSLWQIPVYSPCRNSGFNLSWMVSSLDLFGSHRILGDIVDIGACEATGQLIDTTAIELCYLSFKIKWLTDFKDTLICNMTCSLPEGLILDSNKVYSVTIGDYYISSVNMDHSLTRMNKKSTTLNFKSKKKYIPIQKLSIKITKNKIKLKAKATKDTIAPLLASWGVENTLKKGVILSIPCQIGIGNFYTPVMLIDVEYKSKPDKKASAKSL